VSRRNREKRSEKKSERYYSTTKQHVRQGKVLIPPMMAIPNVQLASWINDRLPEVIWAAVLISHMPRNNALSLFRRVASYAKNLERENLQVPGDVAHTGISEMDSENARELIAVICRDDFARRILRCLALLDDLPARELWLDALGNEQDQDGWSVLAQAVALTLDHQSQEATDCRWLKVLFLAIKGQIKFTSGIPQNIPEEIFGYPDVGDMHAVRPSIRAMEGGLDLARKSPSWSPAFWSQCMRTTPCGPLRFQDPAGELKPGTTLPLVSSAYAQLVNHANGTRITTGLDAKHEIVFGTGLFSLGVLRDLVGIGVGQQIIGRVGLRTLLECYVTLSYLARQDSAEIWQSYRAYGAGQTKLAFLKLAEADSRLTSVSTETLETLANEDMWQEYVSVNLGHWSNSNLRNLSEGAAVKETYDRLSMDFHIRTWTLGRNTRCEFRSVRQSSAQASQDSTHFYKNFGGCGSGCMRADGRHSRIGSKTLSRSEYSNHPEVTRLTSRLLIWESDEGRSRKTPPFFFL
jgi:hypothetical protein